MRTTIVLTIFALTVLVAVLPAGAQGNPPAVECATESWSGDYWKLQINDGEPGQIEANIPAGSVGWSTAGGVFVWVNLHDAPAFRWLMKGGNDPSIVWDGWWIPGDGDSATMPNNLSHVTICFTEGSDPSTTTTTETPTSTQPSPSSTTTTDPGGTTTTDPTPSSTTSTLPATTTTFTDSTTTTQSPVTTTVPPTTTTETPSGGVQTGAGGTSTNNPSWPSLVGGITIGILFGIILGRAWEATLNERQEQ